MGDTEAATGQWRLKFKCLMKSKLNMILLISGYGGGYDNYYGGGVYGGNYGQVHLLILLMNS